MSRVSHIECDICDQPIGKGWWARFKMRCRRRFTLKIREWGHDYPPGSFGWNRRRFDVCGSCWRELIETLRQEVK